jgi:para-nitrobenzyl esterase
MKFLSLLSIALLLPLAMAGSASEITAPIIKIASGELRGETRGDLVIFKGVPFAAPPLGDFRWRPPQPVQLWKGVRSATEFGNECMQAPPVENSNPLLAPLSEDCLYLNVWASRDHKHSGLPVMVWIHGGGFVNGGSSPPAFDGTHFAEQGIVFVSINYRLGRFGFFAFPALTQEGSPVGNYAFMDQIAALKWVQQNIAAFGGDPQRVTIFGESAGGMSVNALLSSPKARGLFVRAVIESGAGRENGVIPTRSLDHPGPNNQPSAVQIGINFARSAGIDGTDAAALVALRNLPAEEIVNGLSMMTEGQQRNTFSGPIIDGSMIVSTVEGAFKNCQQAKVPVMVGANSADMGLMPGKVIGEIFAPFGADADAAQRAFGVTPDSPVAKVSGEVGRAKLMVEPARFIAQQTADCGEPSYEFRFSYVATPLREKLAGAPHSSEIPYVFDTINNSKWGNFGKDLTPEGPALAHQMNAYWVNFGKTGDPNGGGLPNWPRFSTKDDKLMNFTQNGPTSEIDPWAERLNLVEKIQK